MQSVNYEKNLQHAVITAETNARNEYFAYKVSDINQEIGYGIKTIQMIDKMSATVDLAARDEFRMLKNIDAPGFKFNVGLRKVVGNSILSYGGDIFLLTNDYIDYKNGKMESDDFYFSIGSTAAMTTTAFIVERSMTSAGAIAAGSFATISSTFVGASLMGYYMGYKWFKDYLYPVHHWAISQATAKKYGLEAVTNQPWNLMTFTNQSLHMRAGHGMNFLDKPGYGAFGQFWYGTPIWPKAAVGSYGGRFGLDY